MPVRRLLEIVSLTVVYATTIFFIVLAALTTISNIFGAEFGQYLVWLVGGLAAIFHHVEPCLSCGRKLYMGKYDE